MNEKKLGGAGDLVALVAKPIAKVIDAVTGTKLAQCGGCASRQARLNRLMRFKKVDQTPK